MRGATPASVSTESMVSSGRPATEGSVAAGGKATDKSGNADIANTTTFQVTQAEPGWWQLHRAGCLVGMYDSEEAAVRVAFDHASSGPRTRLVVYDSSGRIRAAPKVSIGILPPQTDVPSRQNL